MTHHELRLAISPFARRSLLAYFHTFRCMKNRTARGNSRRAEPHAPGHPAARRLRPVPHQSSSPRPPPRRRAVARPRSRGKSCRRCEAGAGSGRRFAPGPAAPAAHRCRSARTRREVPRSARRTRACLHSVLDSDGMPQRPQMLATFTTAGRQLSVAVSPLASGAAGRGGSSRPGRRSSPPSPSARWSPWRSRTRRSCTLRHNSPARPARRTGRSLPDDAIAVLRPGQVAGKGLGLRAECPALTNHLGEVLRGTSGQGQPCAEFRQSFGRPPADAARRSGDQHHPPASKFGASPSPSIDSERS